VLDAVFVTQYVATLRAARGTCPIDLDTEIVLPAADVNSTGHVVVIDAFWLAQCVASLPNELGPQ